MKKRLRRIDASVLREPGAVRLCPADYCAATLDFCAAKSRSITVRQPLERLARFLTMQAVIFGMFGISELQRRKASPEHIDWASELKAWLEVEVTAEIEAATASTTLTLRTVRMKKVVIFGSHWRRVMRGPLLMRRPCTVPTIPAVMFITQG